MCVTGMTVVWFDIHTRYVRYVNSDAGGSGSSTSCNLFYLTNSLIMASTPVGQLGPGTVLQSQVDYLSDIVHMAMMYHDYCDGFGIGFYYCLTGAAYPTMWASAYLVEDRNLDAQLFCGFDCTFLTMAVGDYSSYINEYGFQLTNGSCSDSVFLDTNWWVTCFPCLHIASFSLCLDRENLYNPPVSLVENYYSCVDTWGNALFNALGISTGNASLALQLFGMLVLPLLFAVLMVRSYVLRYFTLSLLAI
jgi:hypothetical protein